MARCSPTSRTAGELACCCRLLARGAFPEVRLADLHEQVAVGGSERAPLGLGPAAGADGAGRPGLVDGQRHRGEDDEQDGDTQEPGDPAEHRSEAFRVRRRGSSVRRSRTIRCGRGRVDVESVDDLQRVVDHGGGSAEEEVDGLRLFGAAEHERQQSEPEVAVVALPVVGGAAHDLGDHQVEAGPQETELLAEEQVLGAGRDHDQAVGPPVAAVGRGAQHAHHRGDAHAARDQDETGAPADVAGERAVRAVHPDGGSGR